MREGHVCLCLPLERAVFLMDPEINGERERERAQWEEREIEARVQYTEYILYS